MTIISILSVEAAKAVKTNIKVAARMFASELYIAGNNVCRI